MPHTIYAKERDHARIDLLGTSEARIRIRLTTGLSPEFYAEPLTLITQVPAGWSVIAVKQKTANPSHFMPGTGRCNTRLFRTGEKSSCNPIGDGRGLTEIPGPNVLAAGFDPFHESGVGPPIVRSSSNPGPAG